MVDSHENSLRLTRRHHSPAILMVRRSLGALRSLAQFAFASVGAHGGHRYEGPDLSAANAQDPGLARGPGDGQSQAGPAGATGILALEPARAGASPGIAAAKCSRIAGWPGAGLELSVRHRSSPSFPARDGTED